MRFSLTAFFTFCFGLTSAIAGSFQIFEQDASGVADVHAGAAASANTAGTEYYNPAGMTELDYSELSVGLAYIPLDIKFSGYAMGATLAPPKVTTSETDNYIPNFHIVYPVNSRFALGFGITVPFGASTHYSDEIVDLTSAGTKTDLQTVNINPNVAFAVNRFISFGVGFDALYGEAEYDAKFSKGRIPLDNHLTGWGYGWNLGLLLNINPTTRIGASYRSAILLKATGVSSTVFANIPSSTDKLKSSINLPATTMLSLFKQFGNRYTFLFSANHTDWRSFDDLILSSVLIMKNTTDLIIHEDYRDTWDFAVGFHVQLLKQLTLKFGAGYGETPTQDHKRDLRMPDANRYALGMGFHWQIIPSIGLDLGWTHFFIQNAAIDNTDSVSSFIMPTLLKVNGTATMHANVVGLQLSWCPTK